MEEAIMEKTLIRLIDKVDHKYFGKYRGIVVDNNDPENLGRLRVKVPSVLGNEVVTGWAMPCVPYGGASDQGLFAIPEVDAGVWVEFEAGDLEYPIWVGTFWSKPGGTSELPEPANTQSPPTSKILKTVKKHLIELADEDGAEHIQISENDGRNTLILNQQGIEIKDPNNGICMTSNGVLVDSNQIKLGSEGAFEPVVLGFQLLNWLATHTHTSSMGPTGVPIEFPTLNKICSEQNFTL